MKRAAQNLLFVLLTAALAAALRLALPPPQTQTARAEGTTPRFLIYEPNDDGDNTVTITDCKYREFYDDYDMMDWNGPAVTDEFLVTDFQTIASLGYTITRIGADAFKGTTLENTSNNHPSLKNITFPEGLLVIEEGAFSWGYLEYITLPDSLQEIGEDAFWGCESLVSCTITDNSSLETIGESAFFECFALETINLPSGLKSIGGGAFDNCSRLSGVVLPDRLETLGAYAFADCDSLTSINIPSSWTTIPRAVLAGMNSITSVTIPSTVTVIGRDAFANSGLTNVTIPASVETMGAYTFENCKALQSVTFEADSALSDIGQYTFTGCTALKSIEIPKSVPMIRAYDFSGCASLESVTFEDGSVLHTIYQNAFEGCAALTDFVIPPTVTLLSNVVFKDCTSLTEIMIPKGIPSLGTSVFEGCTALESVAFEADSVLTTIYGSSFKGCAALERIELPGGVTTIGMSAFEGCASLTEIEIPDGVTSIGASAFKNCAALSDVDISEDSALATIGDEAFYQSVKEIFLPPSVNNIEVDPFMYLENTGEGMATRFARIHGFYDSYALWWARQKGHTYSVTPSSGDMQANPPGVMYKYIPYEFLVKTRVPNNEGLRFWLEDASGNPLSLPAGMYLVDGVSPLRADAPASAVPGMIYGSPLDYEDFETGVTFTMVAQNTGVDSDKFKAEATFTIYLADTPNNTFLEASVNEYDFTPDSVYGGDGKLPYEITGYYDEIGDLIMHIDGPYELFDSFWIDGVKQTPSTHYIAENGSTRVTVLKKTIQELDNGEHTAAATFRKAPDDGKLITYADWNNGSDNSGSKLDVVAQNFTVNLSERPADGNGGTPGNGNNPGNGYNPGYGYTPGNGGNVGPASGGEPETGNAPDNAPGSDGASTGEGEGEGEGSDTTAADGDIGGAAGADDGAAAGEIGGAADAGAPPGGAEDSFITGLPTDENGVFYFVLDGSGAPLELRIDIPLEEYFDLSFDGELWAAGVDYGVRSGSTVLTIAAERLVRYDGGLHTLSARFESETVEIVFELRKAAVAPDVISPGSRGEAESAAPPRAGDPPVGAAPSRDSKNSGAPGLWIIAVAGAAAVVSGSCFVVIRMRRGKAVK